MARTADMGDWADNEQNERSRRSPEYAPVPQWVELTRSPLCTSDTPAIVVLQQTWMDSEYQVANRQEVRAIEDEDSALGELLRPHAFQLRLYDFHNN